MTRRAAENDLGCCPACRRPFRSVLDFPIVVIEKFEQLPPPEAIDRYSREARSRNSWGRPQETKLGRRISDDGINATPEIATALEREDVRGYFGHLADTVGREVRPDHLLPPWKAHGHFRGAHPIPETRFFFSIHESEDSLPSAGVAGVDILCEGPNLGSGGGPTLSILGPVARIEYRGLLDRDFADRPASSA